jgi:ferredoxin
MEIEIDGKVAHVPDGSTIMDAAQQLGAYIPHFCYHKKLSIAANCRMCLVQVEKAPKPLPACATPVTNGMKVFTHSELAVKAQKGVMEFLLINHPLDCPICDQGGECQLQDLAVGYGGSASRFHEDKRVVFHKDVGPLISMQEMARCIHCTRCVRFGQEIAGVMELGMASRNMHSEITTFVGRSGRFRAVGQHDRPLPGGCFDLQTLPLFGPQLGAVAAQVDQPARQYRRQPDRAGQEQCECCVFCRATTRTSTSAGSRTRSASRTKR